MPFLAIIATAAGSITYAIGSNMAPLFDRLRMLAMQNTSPGIIASANA